MQKKKTTDELGEEGKQETVLSFNKKQCSGQIKQGSYVNVFGPLINVRKRSRMFLLSIYLTSRAPRLNPGQKELKEIDM